MMASFLSRIPFTLRILLRRLLISFLLLNAFNASCWAKTQARPPVSPLYLYFHQQDSHPSNSSLSLMQQKLAPVAIDMGVGAEVSKNTTIQLGLNGLYNKNNEIEKQKSEADDKNCAGTNCLLLNGVSLSAQYKF